MTLKYDALFISGSLNTAIQTCIQHVTNGNFRKNIFEFHAVDCDKVLMFLSTGGGGSCNLSLHLVSNQPQIMPRSCSQSTIPFGTFLTKLGKLAN
jgi:hypothetical protein